MFKNLPFFVNLLLNYKSKSLWAASETWITLLGVVATIAVTQGWVTMEQWEATIYPAILLVLQRFLKKGLTPPA